MNSSPNIQFKNAMNEGPIRATSGSHVMVCVWIGDFAWFVASVPKGIGKNQGNFYKCKFGIICFDLSLFS